MERTITGVVDAVVVPLTDAIVSIVENGLAFLMLAGLWLAFGWALVASQGSLDGAWAWSRGLPLIAQGVAWLLFLPVMLALWIWQTAWPLELRAVLIAGLAGGSLLIFLPRWLSTAKA
jgi:hypothetical protein